MKGRQKTVLSPAPSRISAARLATVRPLSRYGFWEEKTFDLAGLVEASHGELA